MLFYLSTTYRKHEWRRVACTWRQRRPAKLSDLILTPALNANTGSRIKGLRLSPYTWAGVFIHIMGVCVCGKDGKRPKLLIQDPQTGPDDFSWRGPWPSLSSLFLLTGRVTKVIVDQILSTPQSPPRKYLVLLKPFPTCWTSNTKHF